MILSKPDGALLEAVRTLKWPARKRAPPGFAGEHLSRVLGGAAEFTEYRVYRQGDDPARIDWKLLARSDRVFIRLSHERTVLPTTIVVDASASLAYPEATLEKWQYARHVALGLAAAARHGGDPVGLSVATAKGPRQLPPRTRQGAVHDIARLLSEIVPAGTPTLAPLLTRMSSPGRIVIITDFLGDAEGLFTAAARLSAAGREVYAVHVVHANELNPVAAAELLFDPEAPDLRRPLTDQTRPLYVDAFTSWSTELARVWRVAGAIFAHVDTGEPAAYAVRRIVKPGNSASVA